MTQWKKTFACMFMAQVLSILGFSFALPFLPFFIRDLGITDDAQLAWWAGVLLGATGLTLALFAPVWGVLADRFGRKSMVMRSMFGGTLVLLLMSFAQTIGQLFVFRLLQGALTGTVSASVAMVASVTPQRRSGFTLGMMQAAVFVGAAIGPLLGGVLADLYGYRVAFRVGAVVILSGGILVRYGAHEAFSPSDAEDCTPLNFRHLLLNGGFATAVLILLAVRFSNTIVNPSFPLIIRDMLADPSRLNRVTGMVMASAGVTGAVAAAVLGHTGDRLGHRRVVIACSLGAAVTAAAHAYARDLGSLTVIHLLFGLTVSGTLPAVNAMIRNTTDPRHMGKAFGAASSISMLGLALGPLTGGFLARELGLRAPFLMAGICQMFVAALATTISREAVRTD